MGVGQFDRRLLRVRLGRRHVVRGACQLGANQDRGADACDERATECVRDTGRGCLQTGRGGSRRTCCAAEPLGAGRSVEERVLHGADDRNIPPDTLHRGTESAHRDSAVARHSGGGLHVRTEVTNSVDRSRHLTGDLFERSADAVDDSRHGLEQCEPAHERCREPLVLLHQFGDLLERRHERGVENRGNGVEGVQENLPRRDTDRSGRFTERGDDPDHRRGEGLADVEELSEHLRQLAHRANREFGTRELLPSCRDSFTEGLNLRQSIRSQPRIEPLHKRGDRCGSSVDRSGEVTEPAGGTAEYRSGDNSAESAQGGARVLHGAGHCLPGFLRGAADVLLDGVEEHLRGDLALGRHVLHFAGCDTGFFGEPLVDRDAAVGQLVEAVGVGDLAGLNLVEDRTHLGQVGAGDCGGVRCHRQVLGQVLAGFDPGGDSGGGDGSGVTEAIGGASNRVERRRHDFRGGLRIMPETSEFALRVVDGGEAADALGDRDTESSGDRRGGRASSDLQCLAEGTGHAAAGVASCCFTDAACAGESLPQLAGDLRSLSPNGNEPVPELHACHWASFAHEKTPVGSMPSGASLCLSASPLRGSAQPISFADVADQVCQCQILRLVTSSSGSRNHMID